MTGAILPKTFDTIIPIEQVKYYKDEDLNFNYIEMPEYLVPKYQNFTQANILKLREAGYSYDFFNLEEGIKNYLNDLNTSSE